MQFNTLQKDMMAAMKARDKARKDSISVLVSAAKKLAIDEGCREDIPEELVDRVLPNVRTLWISTKQLWQLWKNMHQKCFPKKKLRLF